jgi:hypothetical protein
MKLRKLSLAIFVLVLAALACSLPGSGTDSGGQATPGANTAPAGAGEPAPGGAVPTEESPPAEEPTIPPAGFDPLSLLNLDDPILFNPPGGANTWRTTLDHTFVSLDVTQPVTGAVVLAGATQVEPYASTLQFSSFGQSVLGGQEVFTFTQILDTQYIVFPGVGCMSDTGGQEDTFEVMLDMGGMLKGEAQYVGDENVNGVDTLAYLITQENIDAADPAGINVETLENGRLNVAKDGGFVVRLILDGTGYSEVLSNDASLLGEIYYELNNLDFGQPVDIQPPAACTAPSVDYPIPEDAANINDFGGFITFTTGLGVLEAADFYKTEMPKIGCTGVEEFGGAEGLVLTFTGCPEGTVQVAITPEGEGSSVSILPE